jgi:sortase A
VRGGQCRVLGNRVTYGHPFRQLDKMGPGDLIYVRTFASSCAYRVVPAAQWEPANPHPVRPSDLGGLALASTKQPVLTLVTDTPPGSDAFRLVLRAALDPTARPGG